MVENYQWSPITAHYFPGDCSYGCRMPTTRQLLSSAQVARFVAHGFLRLDGIVPRGMNEEALGVFAAGLPSVPYGTPVPKAFPDGSFAHAARRTARRRGGVGESGGSGSDRRPPLRAHPGAARGQRPAAARRRRHRSAPRRLRRPAHVLPAGGHRGDGRHAHRPRQPSAPHQRDRHRPLPEPARPDPADLPGRHGRAAAPRDLARRTAQRQRHRPPHVQDPLQPDRAPGAAVGHGGPAHARRPGGAGARFPWYEQATGRLEILNRVRLWRALSGDPAFDIEYWATRITNRPAAQRSKA